MSLFEWIFSKNGLILSLNLLAALLIILFRKSIWSCLYGAPPQGVKERFFTGRHLAAGILSTVLSLMLVSRLSQRVDPEPEIEAPKTQIEEVVSRIAPQFFGMDQGKLENYLMVTIVALAIFVAISIYWVCREEESESKHQKGKRKPSVGSNVIDLEQGLSFVEVANDQHLEQEPFEVVVIPSANSAQRFSQDASRSGIQSFPAIEDHGRSELTAKSKSLVSRMTPSEMAKSRDGYRRPKDFTGFWGGRSKRSALSMTPASEL